MTNFFNSFIPIESGKNYEPGKGIIIKGEQSIVALHLTRPLQGNVTLTNNFNERTEFPPTAFVAGGIYNYPIVKIDYADPEDDRAFMGCRFGYKSI